MSDSYFHRVHGMSPTRLWINNPTPEEARKSINAGAIACTTNPTYVANQLKRPNMKQTVNGIIDNAVRRTDNDHQAVDLVMQDLLRPVMAQFLPLYERDSQNAGFVSIQGNPLLDHNADHIIREALEYRKLGANFIAKIAVTTAGLKAIEAMIEESIPVIATEVMGLPQAIATCELYDRTSKRSGNRPPLFVTHITGIFDDYIREAAAREGINIAPDLLWQAGTILARRQYAMMQQRNYPGIMLGGGARGLHHFTEFVGGNMHITINWEGSAADLVEQNPAVVWRMFNPAPERVVSELLEKLPAFKSAYLEDGLQPDAFADFGPVQFFRDMFVKGWNDAAEAVRQRRAANGAA
ncbi:MAG: hypothetical protein EA404_08730 [Spirochaetaceae bacterium]|nr:MAG: hypothetical protein EA404_08730 [Spirochaetaceae bacterium]